MIPRKWYRIAPEDPELPDVRQRDRETWSWDEYDLYHDDGEQMIAERTEALERSREGQKLLDNIDELEALLWVSASEASS